MSNQLFTGLSDFDALAGPLPAGKVTVVAGRPSVGTSAFALTVARHNLAEGRTVAFINYQVAHDSLMGNFLAAESFTNVDRWETPKERRMVRLKRASESLQESRLWTWTPAPDRLLSPFKVPEPPTPSPSTSRRCAAPSTEPSSSAPSSLPPWNWRNWKGCCVSAWK
ncbi:DnaB-like helicase C-terminal domain-containing protein [Streptomyces gilvosporeus]|uniref:DnaB-like helicase C-terminal domain-containing protein n=1 Tax=Streptomyces gilvosporeus TaxID=553510 RepID=UPI00131ABB32|nr:DnaB-like helicase C-terminal domain-containing protein [Streptomyces gilvosporeus]